MLNDQNRARGGARPGAGRKKKESTILRELAIKAANGEAEKSLQFLVEVRDNPDAPVKERRLAAVDIMDRVWGKPRQAVEVGGKDGGPITLQVVSYANNTPTA